MEYVNNENIIISTEIWYKFRKENKDYVEDNKITIEPFKEIITSMVDSSNYIEKTKKGAIEFVGFKWIEKEKEQEKSDKPITNLEMNAVIIEKKNKVKTKQI